MKKLAVYLCMFSIVFAAIAPYASAADSNTPANWTTGQGRKDWMVRNAASDNYWEKAPSMFVRGLHNVAFGWVELIAQPIRHSKNAPLVLGTLTGIVMGIVMTVARTGSGLVDVLTFWVPGFNGWPLSKPVIGLSS